MQCVILAAGRGTRMKNLTEYMPKPMIEVFGKPLLGYKINMLPDHIDEIVLVVGHFGSQIKEYFGSEWNGRRIAYVHQETLNGTGGAIHAAKDMVSGKFLVTMGDDLYGTKDLASLAMYEIAVLAKPSEYPFSAGILRVNEQGNLLEITEKIKTPEMGLINTGAYVLTPDFFEYDLIQISPSEYGLPQTLSAMAKDIPVKVHLADSWLQVSKPEDISKAEDFLRSHGMD